MKLGVDDTLEDWFQKTSKKLPKNIDYKVRYQTIKAAIEVQKKIHQGNVESENNKPDGKQRTLTGHDPEHFPKVIQVASEMVRSDNCNLTAYEVFMLLYAIQIHDIGNIKDRDGHQETAIEIFHDILPSNITLDSVETSIFHSIAEAHTSGSDEDKDTITRLGEYEISHNDAEVDINCWQQ